MTPRVLFDNSSSSAADLRNCCVKLTWSIFFSEVHVTGLQQNVRCIHILVCP